MEKARNPHINKNRKFITKGQVLPKYYREIFKAR